MNGLGDFLEGYMKENDLSLRKFAEQVGLSHTYIDKLIKGVDPRSGKGLWLVRMSTLSLE